MKIFKLHVFGDKTFRAMAKKHDDDVRGATQAGVRRLQDQQTRHADELVRLHEEREEAEDALRKEAFDRIAKVQADKDRIFAEQHAKDVNEIIAQNREMKKDNAALINAINTLPAVRRNEIARMLKQTS